MRTLCLSLFVFLAATPALAAEERIALLPLELGEGLAVTRADLEAAVIRGLHVAGRPLVVPDETAARITRGRGELACQSADCWSRAGALADASYLVGGAIRRSDGVFRVSFRLVRAADGHTLAVEENECEVADCSVAELARRSARELLRQTLGSRPSGAAAGEPGAGPPVVAASREEPGRPVWPLLAVGAGLATAAAGVLLITMHDDCADRGCARLYDTLWGGIAVVGVGVAAVTVGVLHLGGDRGGPQVALYVGPAGLTAAGRF